ncbi:hypothetical protein JCM8202_003403 [Rhodotorula sphaerocarpa]
MGRTKAASVASVGKTRSTLGPIPPYAPWPDFNRRESARLAEENPKLSTKLRRKRVSKLYAAAKAEKENSESDRSTSAA